LIAAGTSIGNYRILSKIGTGGMGAVYLAEHPLIGKKVALKVIHRELANNREVVQRFFQEARAVNKIGNEHIVQIHDFAVTPEGDHFYIMEYLEGRTLASVLSKERVLDVMGALHIGAQIANALAAAHASGVIHRDLKPDNIMLMQRLGDPMFVKVLDFGLAKMFAEHASTVKTAAGVLLGTPQYMSPEACESKRDIDHRTDIYALGVLLYQMLTGVLPFDGESMGEVLIKQVTQLPPAPRAINPNLPPSVEQVLLRCLAKQPDMRFPTMIALREALLDPEAYLRGSPPIAPARSLAPGEAKVDAKTVMMHAEASQRAKQGSALPLPAPRTSDAHVAATVIADPSGPNKRLPTGVPDLAPPAEPINHTMRIGTPIGYSSRPPRKMWPIVLVLGLLLGLGGGAFAVAWVGRDKAAAGPAAAGSDVVANAGSASGADSSTSPGGNPNPIAVDAGAATSPDSRPATQEHGGSGSGSAVAAVRTAMLQIDSVPQGAIVSCRKKTLGITPLKVEWPVSDEEVTFDLRLAGYKKKPKTIAVTGNIALRLELEKLAPVIRNPNRDRGSGARGSSSDTGLERPE
jgi:serine/threonine-protein kinase